jgi:hypothetical protein
MRSGGYSGFGVIGLHRSAPTSKRSFWILVSSTTSALFRCPAAIATPMAEFASSTSPYAASRGSVFDVVELSPRRVSPASPVRV